MKKLALFFAALFMSMLFVSCSQCSSEPEQKADDATVIKTDNFEEIIGIVIPIVNQKYPTYSFYEAGGTIKMNDSVVGIDRNTFRLALGCMTKNASVVCTIKNDTLVFQEYDEPWLEDIHMTPYVPVTLAQAIEEIQKHVDLAPEGLPAVLRHQLYPGEAEPRWFIGTWSTCHTVNVYTFGFDVPLKDFDGLMIKKDDEQK